MASANYFSGDVVSRSDAREVAAAWALLQRGNLVYLALAGPLAGRVLKLQDSRAARGPVVTDSEEETMAKKTFLDFEQPIAELETKIEELRYVQNESAVDISAEIEQLSKKSQQLTKDIYSDLTPWQITKIARHAERPYTLDYINEIFTHFVELHGDRHFADDLSIVGGLARFNGTPAWCWASKRGVTPKSAVCATLA
jgi:hypothetical protein